MFKVELWWRELLQRLVNSRKNLARLENQCHYDRTGNTHKLYEGAN